MGKTTLACRILETLPGWGALKLSPVRPHACGADPACPECHGLSGDSDLTLDSEGPPESGTSRYAAAGAARVGWLRGSEQGLYRAVPRALEQLSNLPGLLVEGNSFARYAQPDRIVLVARAGLLEVKGSAREIFAVADWIVLNRSEGADPRWMEGEKDRLRHRGAGRILEVDAAAPGAPSTQAFLGEVRAWARP